jgi:hypothetical protein
MHISVASPPPTPLNLEFLSQMQYQCLAPPMSAPAQYSSFAEYSPISAGPLSAVSWAISTPDTPSFQVNLQPPNYVYEQDDDDGQLSQWPLTEPTSLCGRLEDSETPPAASTGVHDGHKATQFHIHEFPRQQEAHRSVAQQMPPQGPKHYTFTNQTASDF